MSTIDHARLVAGAIAAQDPALVADLAARVDAADLLPDVGWSLAWGIVVRLAAQGRPFTADAVIVVEDPALLAPGFTAGSMTVRAVHPQVDAALDATLATIADPATDAMAAATRIHWRRHARAAA